ncbi:colicin D domain-containing protein [Anaeromyxobacter sp. SG17]|uniref:colicin D domain-containing protein n=1 Tax=Anaeromyxobacter TaxID=161492 RepID=UPI0035A882D1
MQGRSAIPRTEYWNSGWGLLNQHINRPGVRAITGTYRGNPVTHYLDPQTGLNVIADPAGNYVSGWRLGAEQVESVLTNGRLF